MPVDAGKNPLAIEQPVSVHHVAYLDAALWRASASAQ